MTIRGEFRKEANEKYTKMEDKIVGAAKAINARKRGKRKQRKLHSG